MGRNGTYSRNIEKYFLEHPGKIVGVKELQEAAKCSSTGVSAAISYLRKKERQGKGGLRIITMVRGKEWMFSLTTPTKPKRMTVPVTPAVNEGAMNITREMRELASKSLPDWAQAEQAFRDQTHAVIRLVLVGTTTEGYHIGKDEDSGNVFKVVPI